MKKVLEGELLSIAHRILQMKDKEDVSRLYYEAKEVYEKLFILKFYHENQEVLKKSLSQDTLEKQLELATREEGEGGTVFGNEAIEKPRERSQMPTDLIEEEYPIVVEQEEGSQSHIKTELMREEAVKVNSEIELTDFEKKNIQYENQFIETPFNESIEESEEDQLIHQYLDQHEAMLKNQESKHIQDLTPTEEELLAVKEETEKVATHIEEDDVPSVMVDSEPMMDSDSFTSSMENNEQATMHIEEDEMPSIMVENESLLESDSLVTSFESDEKVFNLEDPFSGFDFGEVDFVRVEDVEKEEVAKFDLAFKAVDDTPPALEKEDGLPVQSLFDFEKEVVVENKQKSLNDIYNSTITVGLNDRIGFENHLFNGSAEDLNRVLSQLNTVNTWEEARSFIAELVKPDYNNWEGKEAYETRFMELVAKRFI